MSKILEEDEGPDGGDPAEHLAAAELIRQFYVKHRRSLEADGLDVTAFLHELAGQVEVYAKAVEAEDKAMDAYLLARANQAEAAAQLTEYEFQILQYFEKMSEADWAAILRSNRRNYGPPSTASERRCPSGWLPCPSKNAVSWRDWNEWNQPGHSTHCVLPRLAY